ncbi:hypothetical protein D3C73_1348040 [compost metagenome]
MLDHRCRQKLKTDIMMQLHRRLHEPFLQNSVPLPGRIPVQLLAGHIMHDPEQSGPEACRPPVRADIVKFAVLAGEMRAFIPDLFNHPRSLYV